MYTDHIICVTYHLSPVSPITYRLPLITNQSPTDIHQFLMELTQPLVSNYTHPHPRYDVSLLSGVRSRGGGLLVEVEREGGELGITLTRGRGGHVVVGGITTASIAERCVPYTSSCTHQLMLITTVTVTSQYECCNNKIECFLTCLN